MIEDFFFPNSSTKVEETQLLSSEGQTRHLTYSLQALTPMLNFVLL